MATDGRSVSRMTAARRVKAAIDDMRPHQDRREYAAVPFTQKPIILGVCGGPKSRQYESGSDDRHQESDETHATMLGGPATGPVEPGVLTTESPGHTPTGVKYGWPTG